MKNISVPSLLTKITIENNLDTKNEDLLLLKTLLDPYVKICRYCSVKDICIRMNKCDECNHYQCNNHQINNCHFCNKCVCIDCMNRCNCCNVALCRQYECNSILCHMCTNSICKNCVMYYGDDTVCCKQKKCNRCKYDVCHSMIIKCDTCDNEICVKCNKFHECNNEYE